MPLVTAKLMNKIFYVNINDNCNNFCLGCGAPPKGKTRSVDEIVKDLETGTKVGYQSLHLIGGEPTVQENLYELLKIGRKMFKKIYLTSNGRRFAHNEFTKKISGLVDGISISLYGHTPYLHESWTRTKKSFSQTVVGIKNLVRYKDKTVCVNHLIWKGNYNQLRQLLLFDINLGVKKISLLNLEPTGRAKKIFSSACVPLLKLDNFDLQFIDLVDQFESIEVEDFPRCLFSPQINAKNNFHIQDISGNVYLDEFNQITTYGIFAIKEKGFGINSNLEIMKNLKKIIPVLNSYRIKLKNCNNCQFSEDCGGIFKEYVKIFSRRKVEKEIEEIRKKY